MATSTPASASSPANIIPVGPPPAITTACSFIVPPFVGSCASADDDAAWPGPCRKPPVRNNLEVGRRGILFLRFSVVGGQSLYEAAVRVLLFEQKRSAGSHPLVEQQTLPQTTAPNHCYGYRCTIPRRSVPIRSPSVVSEATTEEKLVAGF